MPRKARTTPKPTTDRAPITTTPPARPGVVALSPAAQALFDDVVDTWDLSPPVRALLLLGCECLTKAEEAEAICQVEGMTCRDAKGSSKAHPAAVLAERYRSQAATTIQRILSNLGG
jgi:hypothetical protein